MDTKDLIKWTSYTQLAAAAGKENENLIERELALDLYIEQLHIDDLTGLRNRRAMDDIGLDDYVAMLLFEDIYWINEEYGEGVGDYLVCFLADKLTQLDIPVYRFHGLVFVLTHPEKSRLESGLQELQNMIHVQILKLSNNGNELEFPVPGFCYGIATNRHDAESTMRDCVNRKQWKK